MRTQDAAHATAEGAAGAANRRLPALDGVRGIAIAVVMLFHAGTPHMAGGFLGVDIFFVLSGFLITTLMLKEFARHRAVNLRDFWIRRALRLFPALVPVLIVVALYLLFLAEPESRALGWRDLLAAATYHSNWAIALSNHYDGTAVPLGHTWSLSLELQFYVLWPLVVLAGVMVWRRWRGTDPTPRELSAAVFIVAGSLAVASGLVRVLEFHAGWGWWRIYGGTDSRTDALLLGCALAGAVGMGWLSRLPGWSGPVGLLLIGYCISRSRLLDPWTAQWGFFLVALGATAVTAAATAGHFLVRPLSWAPLAFLGRISYGTYLWHFPVWWVLYLEGNPWGLSARQTVEAISLAVILGTLSYFVVERPSLRLKARYEHAWLGAPAQGPVTVGKRAGESDEISRSGRDGGRGTGS